MTTRSSKYTVKMHWNVATEQWRMTIHGLTVQENDGDTINNPREFFNCVSLNMLFPGLDKRVPHNYKVTTELLDEDPES